MHKEGLPKQSLFVSATNETMKSLVGYPMTYTPRLCILLSRDGGNATKIKNMEELEMSTVLSRQDIINIIYGATVLGAGGGGSASSGLEMLENYIKKHGDPKLRMISTGEMNVNAYAAVTAGMGSPVALKDIDFTPYAVNAYNALVDMAATMGRTLSYTIPVEIGGFNTFVPMLIAMMNDIPVIDADGAARAVPALDTLLLHVNGLDTSPLAMADHKNNRLTIELADPRDAHEAEVIGRNICVAFDRAGHIAHATFALKTAHCRVVFLHVFHLAFSHEALGPFFIGSYSRLCKNSLLDFRRSAALCTAAPK